jgi:chromosome segregation protein
MKIKSLEIHGFKSFVDRVRFAFPTGTSAIVGPNGCGKSNVVDAIRWVLGEHNARHLRGAHMEDLIFNGSDNRKPLGMAEVTMTLSNESGLAPARFVDFTEIEVKRRLYRSGESEYFINKVPSRLKDVVELFTDTGVGTSAYSIIEQGQVGWLVNAKPVERRVIFEEAAGINKYKQKKDASIRRLEATKLNLTRVNDIISEVKRQLGALDRQARKAERYKKLKAELKALDLYLSAADYAKHSEARGDASKRFEALKDEELALGADLDGVESRINLLKVDYLAAEKEFQEVRERAIEVERRIQAEERVGELLRLRGEELDRNDLRLAGEIDELGATVALLAEEIARLNEAFAGMSIELESLSARLASAEAAVADVNGRISEKTEALKTVEADFAVNSARLTDIKYSIELAIKEEKTQREAEAKAGAELLQAEGELARIASPIEELRRSLTESTGRKEGLSCRIGEISGAIARLELERGAKEDELKRNKEESAAVGARISALEEMERRYEGLGDGVKAIMESSKAGERGGIHGLLADVIEPEPGFERAVEAVLGQKLQYVMVESQAEGVEAIEYLRAQNRGRASLLPVRDARAGAVEADAEKLKALGLQPLSERVSVKEGFRDAVNYLLSDAVMVNDLSSAASLWRQNGMYKTFVTPGGEMIDRHGVMTGGATTAAGVDSGLLTKKREMAEARERLSSVSIGIETLEAELGRLRGEIQSARAEYEEARETLHRENIGEVGIVGELRKHELETERLAARKDALVKDRAFSLSEIERVLGRKSGLANEREVLEKAGVETEARINALKSELSALAVEKDALAHGVTEAKVACASMRERHESARAGMEEKERQKSDAEARIGTKKTEAAQGRTEKAETVARMEAIKEGIAALLQEKDGVKAVEIERQKDIAELSERINALDRELKDKRKTLADVQKRKGEASVELMELEIAIRNLLERVTEKYGVEIASYAPAPEETETLAAMEEGPESYAGRAAGLREKITSLGEVSLAALDEYTELTERHNFLVAQKADLEKSVEELFEAIARINRTTRERFQKTFEEIDRKFRETFPKFFNGGRAELRLSDENDVLESGIEIVAQPPGKKLQNIMLLSGGEKALTATAFIFSVFLIKPSPFCLLDEVDAPLDDANVERFNGFVKEMSKMSQFILITHNKRTMEVADTLYGVTMEEPGVSKTVSVEF